MHNKIFRIWLFNLCVMCFLAGCGSGKNEASYASDAALEDELSSEVIELNNAEDNTNAATADAPVENAALDYLAMEKIVSDGELSALVGASIDTTDEESRKLNENKAFQCILNAEKQVMAIATTDATLCLYDISPQLSLDAAIETLLLDQWSYEAEYFWYSENTDTTENESLITCYQSAVFEKNGFEYIITTNTENNYGTICAIELIDKDMFANNSSENKNETAFSRLHGLS